MTALSGKFLELHLTPLKPLCCHHLPSRADFLLRICLICIHFFLACISICTFTSYFRKACWMISGHNYTFFLSLVFSRDTYYIQVGSLGFPQLSFFNLTTFRSVSPVHFTPFSDDVSSTITSSRVSPPALSQFCCCPVARSCPAPLWPHGLQEACVSVLGQLYLCALEIFLTTLTCQLLCL